MRAVIDTNVLIHGRGNLDYDRVYVVEGVVEEAKSEAGKNVLRNLDYEVFQPSENAVKQVEQRSREINSPTSQVDEELVALAMEKDVRLVTDDKAMQNLCLHLDIEFDGFHDTALQETQAWKKLCGNCGVEVSTPPCPRCGSRRLRRKQVQSS
jgi:rRNA maturation endonuclease Nob1